MALAYRHLGFVLWELGRPREAIDTLKLALRAGASNEQVRSQLATYLAETGSAREAITLVEPDAERSTDAETVNALGIAYARSGAREAAQRTFARVLTLDARNALALQNLGTLRLEAGEFAAAEQAFRRALDVDPRLAPAHTGLGVVSERNGDRSAAIEHWRRAVELDPSEFNALYNLATRLVEQGRVSEAMPYLDRFVRTAPPGLYAADIREMSQLLARLQKGRMVEYR
jgi:tetratricopeptide (TPR) repeat protein